MKRDLVSFFPGNIDLAVRVDRGMLMSSRNQALARSHSSL